MPEFRILRQLYGVFLSWLDMFYVLGQKLLVPMLESILRDLAMKASVQIGVK